jgi:hypothetical protein
VRSRSAFSLGGLFLATMYLATIQVACAQGTISSPKSVEAGSAFSIQTTGSGKAVLYIVGPAQVLERDVQLGESMSFPAGSLYNAGHYLAILAGVSSTDHDSFDVVPANRPADLAFFAKPSRLPVGLHNGISGTVYVFDAYRNLITAPSSVSFELETPSGAVQKRTVNTQNGVAWTQMDSTAKEGISKFKAQVDGISSARVVEQVPGDPCGLRMSAQQSGGKLQLKTDPVRDCSGNAVPDGTIVTFTESYNGMQSTVDAPLKRGIAQAEMPAHNGARISVASGVVLGNEIHWAK